MLFHIATAPEPGASQTEIARFADMGGPALVRHIDRLEADGLVTRTRDAIDRRLTRVRLTPAGAERMEELKVVMGRCDERLRNVVSEREAAVMQRALDKIFAFCLAEMQAQTPASIPVIDRRSADRRRQP